MSDRHKTGYSRAYDRENRRKARDYVDFYKLSHGCSLCGYCKCAKALHFHHIHGNKEFSIATSVGSKSNIPRIRREMDKCIVVCANCHAEIHAGRVEGFSPVVKERTRNDDLPLLRLISGGQ